MRNSLNFYGIRLDERFRDLFPDHGIDIEIIWPFTPDRNGHYQLLLKQQEIMAQIKYPLITPRHILLKQLPIIPLTHLNPTLTEERDVKLAISYLPHEAKIYVLKRFGIKISKTSQPELCYHLNDRIYQYLQDPDYQDAIVNILKYYQYELDRKYGVVKSWSIEKCQFVYAMGLLGAGGLACLGVLFLYFKAIKPNIMNIQMVTTVITNTPSYSLNTIYRSLYSYGFMGFLLIVALRFNATIAKGIEEYNLLSLPFSSRDLCTVSSSVARIEYIISEMPALMARKNRNDMIEYTDNQLLDERADIRNETAQLRQDMQSRISGELNTMNHKINNTISLIQNIQNNELDLTEAARTSYIPHY